MKYKINLCLIAVLAVVSLMALPLVGCSNSDKSTDTNATLTEEETIETNQASEEIAEVEKADENVAQTTPEVSTQEPAPVEDVPTEYKSALRQAQNYSKLMHMSKQGIYDQLTSEYGGKFSADAAQYAIDNIQADWNANALAQAENYQNTMAMSPDAIYDQLISEYGGKFTPEEAQYAMDHLS